jgi:hypothetical protein
VRRNGWHPRRIAEIPLAEMARYLQGEGLRVDLKVLPMFLANYLSACGEQ